MYESPIHRSMQHLLLEQRLEEARRESADERRARAARIPRHRRWRAVLSSLLVHLGGLLIAAGEALRGEPVPAPAER